MKMVTNVTAPGRMNVKWARIASILNLSAIGVSGILFLNDYDRLGLSALVIVLITAGALLGTGVYRIAGGKQLDEFEINMARKAYYYAYSILAAGLLLGVFIARVSFPSMDFTELDSVLEFTVWGLIDVVMVLPAAILAWILPTAEIDADEI